MGGFKGRLYRGLALRLCVVGCVYAWGMRYMSARVRAREGCITPPQAPPRCICYTAAVPHNAAHNAPLEGGIGITRPITLLLVTRSVRTKIEGRL